MRRSDCTAFSLSGVYIYTVKAFLSEKGIEWIMNGKDEESLPKFLKPEVHDSFCRITVSNIV